MERDWCLFFFFFFFFKCSLFYVSILICLVSCRMCAESKREKEKNKDDNHWSNDGLSVSNTLGCSSATTVSTMTTTSSFSPPTTTTSAPCNSASSSNASCDASRCPPQPEISKKGDRPVSLHVSSLAWNKRSGTGLVGAARARGWLRSYHQGSNVSPLASPTVPCPDQAGSDTVDNAPTSPATERSVSSSPCSIPAPSALFSNSTNTTTSASTSASACITQAFAATLNAALASGPLAPTPSTPTLPGNPLAHNHTIDSPAAAHLPVTSRPSNLPPGMSPGHGLLSALVGGGNSAGTPPTQRQTTQVMLGTNSCSATSSTPTMTISSNNSTAVSSLISRSNEAQGR